MPFQTLKVCVYLQQAHMTDEITLTGTMTWITKSQ